MGFSIKDVVFSAHIAPLHAGRSCVDVDAETGDVVLRDGVAGASRFSFDTVTYHPFHTTAYESVLARRVAENFGAGCPYALNIPPYSMHGAIIHGSPYTHSMELFHALVLSSVRHAIGVLAKTGVGHALLHYSMVRVHSWGVTDVLNQQVVANRPSGVYMHEAQEYCRPHLQHNVVNGPDDTVLENIIRASLSTDGDYLGIGG